jgi:chorismate mutase
MESLQPSRWAEVLKTKKALAKDFGLSENLIENIWNMIHEYAIKEEDKQKNI